MFFETSGRHPDGDDEERATLRRPLRRVICYVLLFGPLIYGLTVAALPPASMPAGVPEWAAGLLVLTFIVTWAVSLRGLPFVLVMVGLSTAYWALGALPWLEAEGQRIPPESGWSATAAAAIGQRAAAMWPSTTLAATWAWAAVAATALHGVWYVLSRCVGASPPAQFDGLLGHRVRTRLRPDDPVAFVVYPGAGVYECVTERDFRELGAVIPIRHDLSESPPPAAPPAAPQATPPAVRHMRRAGWHRLSDGTVRIFTTIPRTQARPLQPGKPPILKSLLNPCLDGFRIIEESGAATTEAKDVQLISRPLRGERPWPPAASVRVHVPRAGAELLLEARCLSTDRAGPGRLVVERLTWGGLQLEPLTGIPTDADRTLRPGSLRAGTARLAIRASAADDHEVKRVVDAVARLSRAGAAISRVTVRSPNDPAEVQSWEAAFETPAARFAATYVMWAAHKAAALPESIGIDGRDGAVEHAHDGLRLYDAGRTLVVIGQGTILPLPLPGPDELASLARWLRVMREVTDLVAPRQPADAPVPANRA